MGSSVSMCRFHMYSQVSQDPLPLIKKEIRELPNAVYFREFSLSQIAFVFCVFSG